MTLEEAIRITQAMTAREFYDACLIVIPYNIGPARLTPNRDDILNRDPRHKEHQWQQRE